MELALKTPEQIDRENREQLAKYRPIDDDFMRELFRNNIPLAQFVLRIITGKEDLIIIAQETQYDLKRLAGARSLQLDYLGEDSEKQKYNLEIQRADKGAEPERARFHSSSIDVEFLDAKDDFSSLPTTFVIFFTENDFFRENRPVYLIDRVNTTTGKPFNDREHIIYVNGAYNNEEDNSDIAKLTHDFRCSNADDMLLEPMAERTRYFKTDPKGVTYMCKMMEDRVKETAKETAVEIARKMILKGLGSPDDIADCSNLTVDEVMAIAKELKPAT